MTRTLSTAVAAALSIAFLAGAVASAQSTSSTQETIPMTESSTATRFVPATHRQVNQRNVEVDGEAATLTRHERQDGRNAGLEGEHFSTVVAADGTLKGFANMSLDLVGKPLPSRERSEQIARAFMQETAPDLLPRMKISWIDPHDEPIRVQRNGQTETVTLTGMKVKARNLADGRWFWVIVGADEKPMVFERDIVWITFPGHRKTEKWLHDSWLKAQEQ
ncbi:hypothetical protein EHF36_12285 [Kerstersia gyiorum]|uniref:hypothetical protein n=1 Tax=Kerstersia gyiorum TaxID=206506 RepID=UPI001071445D|nr:hypothetical protein [Kerstersia gyiorum]QBR41313.1 hypothetical protein EHF36_12285 [Kerstersia gyiorum]